MKLKDIKNRDQVWNQVNDQVWDQIRSQVLNQVRDQVSSQVSNQVWTQILLPVRNQVSIQVKDHVEWMDVIGPGEIESLFGEKGAVIGIASTVQQARSKRLDSRIPVKGLYHCGDDSGIDLWGVGTELAAKSGNGCAKLILYEEL